jgi:LPXTG-motif cell wall-anchored protein
VIFSGTTLPNGNFYDETSLPTDCRPGSHSLVLSGTSPSGATVSDYVTYTVDENCTVTAFDPYAGAAGSYEELANTGFDVSPWITVSGFIAALGAAATVIVRRRKA